MGRWVYVALIAGAFVACSLEDPSPSSDGRNSQAGKGGDEDGGEPPAQAGSAASSGGQAGVSAGGAAASGPQTGGQGGAGHDTGGEPSQAEGGDTGHPAGGDGGAPGTCDPTLCQNDGTCPAGASSCRCTGGFTGPRCELPRFEVLEPPVGATYMVASGISADGQVVVGKVTFPTYSAAYRWTRATGVVLLDRLPDDAAGAAAQISADGKVVIGSSGTSGMALEPVVWSGAKPPQLLASLSLKAMTATHVNAKGNVVAGVASRPDDTFVAFRWTDATGPVELGFGGSGDPVSVAAISADGATIVANWGASQAFVWTKAAGAKLLAPLPGDEDAVVQGMSADGKTIIGNSLSAEGVTSKRVLWINGAAPVQLDPLDAGTGWTCGGGPIQTCTTVYDDGSLVYTQRESAPVRYSADGLQPFAKIAGKMACIAVAPTVGPAGKVVGTCFGPPLAVTWDADGNVATLADVLTQAGADAFLLAESTVSIVRAVSANGDTVVGDNMFAHLVWVARPPQ